MFYKDRIEYMKNRVIHTTPEMDLENAKILTDSFKETGGEPLCIRKAKAFRKQCREKTVKIWDQELIVGCSGSKMRGGILCADTCWSILDEELDTISTRKYDPFYLRPEDRELFLNEIKPYWEGRSTYEAWLKQIPDDCRELRDAGQVYINRKAVRGWGETTAGYRQIIEEGIESICETIRERMARLDPTVPGDIEKENYLKAMLISAEGICDLADRYADEASRLAGLETDETRRGELMAIAAACRHVPRYPARSFHEALQSLYLYQICIFMEQNAASYNPGRMDQYLYPYYKADIEKGVLTEEKAQELLDCLWIKFSEPCLFQDAETAEFAAGYPMFQNVCVGGVTVRGEDAVNDLSYLILQATMDVRLYQPSLSVRYSMAKNPNRFLRKVVELIRLGTGFPAFHNDDVGIRMVMNKGIPLREALDWNPCGCVETNLSGRLKEYTDIADINMGAMVELALNDGKSRITGEQVSVHTGDPREFKSFDDFFDAVKKHIDYAVDVVTSGNQLLDYLSMNYRPVPVLSLGFPHCMEAGKDYSQPGAAKYTVGGGVITVGQADIVNSVAAVKYLVFDEKKLTMDRLIQALDADFKGYEDVQAMCLAAPKYGNDDERADFCVGEIFTHVVDQFEKYDNLRNAPRVEQHPDRTVGGRTALRAQREDAADRRHRSHRRHGCEWPDGTLKIRQPHPPRAFHPGHAAQHEV